MYDKIFCHLCRKELRDCGFWNESYHFVCDTKTCPTDEFQIKVIIKPAKQEDGSYLTVI